MFSIRDLKSSIFVSVYYCYSKVVSTKGREKNRQWWVLAFKYACKNLQALTVRMKATEQYFPVVLSVMLYKVVLTFESVGEILKCDHSNESY